MEVFQIQSAETFTLYMLWVTETFTQLKTLNLIQPSEFVLR